jgi:hypothetical protein
MLLLLMMKMMIKMCVREKEEDDVVKFDSGMKDMIFQFREETQLFEY